MSAIHLCIAAMGRSYRALHERDSPLYRGHGPLLQPIGFV
jgi:hypothetical protein